QRGQRLFGDTDGWFVNTNSGLRFKGALSGKERPSSGIFYDAAAGSALICEEAVVLDGFHLLGRGYKQQGVKISAPSPSTPFPVTGIESRAFIIMRNMSVYYFD